MDAISTETLAPEKERLAKMLKALGNPIRFQIVEFLAKNQTCITNDIVHNTPLAQSTVSQHLKVLREAGLIRSEKKGVEVINTLRRADLDQRFPGLLDAVFPRQKTPSP